MKKLGFGFMRLPVLDENDRSTVDFEAVREMVDYYMQVGFSYFDTAHRYNDDMSETALRFAAGLEGVEMVLSGMSTMEQVKDNTGFMGQFIPLGEKEQELLKRAAAAIRKNTAIACTNCCYCTTECPRNLAIPQYFALYNNMKRLKNTAYMTNQPVYYANLVQNHGRASDCIRCGKCEKNCPQRLPIRELLQQVSAVFDC